ncbi:MAG: carboxypeptidase regulatory-like domain-containing protein [Terriglobales bacterium]
MSSLVQQIRKHALFQILTLIIVILLPVVLFGQGYFGTVSGLLTDPSGAVVQGAKVVLTDEQRGYQFKATSDETGRYLFRAIPPGVYSVTAEKQGFEKNVRTHIKLDVSENATANLSLRLASAKESVEVKAQTETIETQDATTGQVIDRKFINDLPLIGRDVMALTYLAPGVTDMDDQCPNCNETGFVSNGSRGGSADILLDGASVTNVEANGGTNQMAYDPPVESVDEFKVQQTNFSAEYGFTGASVINMVTRSGTNAFHGSVYDFLRNSLTDANDWFANRAAVPRPTQQRNEYGVTFGGPIFKNKTFFFADYQGTKQIQESTASAGVPSSDERAGNFAELCTTQNGGVFGTGTDPNTGATYNNVCTDGQGNLLSAGQLWDPYSGVYNSSVGLAQRFTPIPNNNIATYTSPGNPKLAGTPYQLPGTPGNLIDPVAAKMINLFPAANNPAGGPFDNWTDSGPVHYSDAKAEIKIDQRFNANNMLTAKYSQEWDNHSQVWSCFNDFVDPCSEGPNDFTAHVIAINETHTFNPTTLLITTLGFTRNTYNEQQYAYSSSVPDPLGTLGFPSYLGANGFTGVPAIFINGYPSAGYTSLGDDPYGNYREGENNGQLTVTLSKVRGPHEMKFGFDGRLRQINYIQTNAPLGNFGFDSTGSSEFSSTDNSTYGGDGMASFLMGQMLGGGNTGYEIQFRPSMENYQYSWFAQDNWKASSKLTVNAGLRYELALPRTERHNRQNWFDPGVINPLNGGSISYQDPLTMQPVTRTLYGGERFTNGNERTNWDTDYKNFQPRFGLAYRFADKTVLRGGYGIYFGQTRSGANGVGSYGTQGYNVYTSAITTYQNDGATPYLRMSNPYPNGFEQPAGSSLGLLNDVGFGAVGPIRSGYAIKMPYEQSWSFGFEQQLPSNTVIDVEYIGKKGTHLYFSGANSLDILGPWVENASPGTLNNLLSYVTNPFSSANGGPISDPNSALSYAQVPGYQLELPYPQFTGVTTDVRPIANSIYHGLQIKAEKRYSNGLQFLVTYTWSKSIDDSSIYDDNITYIGSFTSLQDPNKPWLERSLSTFDIPQVVQFTYTYDLPIGHGRAFLGSMPRALDAVVGGWKTNGIWRISEGRPLTVTVGGGGTPLPTYGAQRPNIVGTPERAGGKDSDWVNQYFANPNVFQYPNEFTLGDAPRALSDIRSPLIFSSDLSIEKEFPMAKLHEGLNAEVRLEAQNAFNHPTFSMGAPGPYGSDTLNVGYSDFGQITSMGPIGPRQVQLALKISF